jgi:hypothetical protein
VSASVTPDVRAPGLFLSFSRPSRLPRTGPPGSNHYAREGVGQELEQNKRHALERYPAASPLPFINQVRQSAEPARRA